MVASYPALRVCCCYDLADLGFYQAFKKQLAPLIHRGWIHLWDEQQIPLGQEMMQEREQHLRSADLLLFLISPDFLASETSQYQMSIALEMHRSQEIVTLPILLRPCRWQETILSSFQMLPRQQKALNTLTNPDEAWEGIVTEISHIVEIKRRWVFVISAPSDRGIVEQLRGDLARDHLVLWSQQKESISSDLNWDTDVRDAMRSSFAVVVVASPEARASRMVKAQLDLAADYRRPILVIWTKGEDWETSNPGHWHSEEVLDIRAERYEATKALLLERLRQSRRILIPPQKHFLQKPRNPYKGLQAFGEKDARDFFGRAALIDEMATEVEKILVQEKKERQRRSRLLTVLGASGSGKSSVVMAGLLPCLQQGRVFNSQEWIYLDPMVPGAHPLEALAVSLSQQPSLKDISSLSNALASDSVRTLHLLIRQLVGFSQKKVLLIIDQFEEVFTLTATEEERQHFFALLITATTELEGSLLVILTLRADFYERPMQYPVFYHLLDTHRISVLPMGREDLRQVIEQPANLSDVQLTFEGDLVGDLLFETRGQVGALPLLEFTLHQLFLHRDGHHLTLQAYHEIGGVKGALTRHAEETYAALPSEEHRKLARALFVRLIDLGVSEQDTTRRRAMLSEFSLPSPTQTRLLREVIDTFNEARLLISNKLSGTNTIEISHEALIREWMRLADWLVTNRNDILLQKAISEDVAAWIRRGNPNDRLYRGTQLAEAQAWAERTMPSVDEVAFLQASVTEHEREQAERAQEKAERALQGRELGLQRLAARRLRYLSGMTAVTAVVLAVGLIVSLILYAQLQVSLPASVTNFNDNGPGSLREAIKNASPGSTISFAKNLKGTISLTSGELVITKNLIIAGPGSNLLSISGSEVSRVFNVHEGVTMAISGVTIKKGYTSDDTGGGGILNDGALTLTDSIVSECRSARSGGAIHNGGTLTITTSTISGNKAYKEGGGGIGNAGTLTIIRSTVSYNTAISAGGGIEDGYTLSLLNSTIAYNSVTSGGNYGGGGLSFGDGGQASIFQSTIYGNTATTAYGGNILAVRAPVKLLQSIIAGGNARRGKDIWGSVISFGHGYNLIGTLNETNLNDDHSTIPINFIGSPKVGPLQDNGGPTQTIALLAGSPAIDFIPLDSCQSRIDQRGRPRPSGNVPACDIGAYESSGLSTVTAQAKANATAETVANTSSIAYPPHNQSPVLADPLQDNSKGNNWEEDTSKGNCKFIDGAFDINTTDQEWCPAMSTDFTNFIYEIQMKFVKGDGGGIAFRIDPQDSQQYYSAIINLDGSYNIQASGIVLASGSSSAIHPGLNQTNLVAAVVHGPVIELYVNLQRVAVVSMVVGSRPPTHGHIGVIVTPLDHHQTEVIFQNAKVWTF